MNYDLRIHQTCKSKEPPYEIEVIHEYKNYSDAIYVEIHQEGKNVKVALNDIIEEWVNQEDNTELTIRCSQLEKENTRLKQKIEHYKMLYEKCPNKKGIFDLPKIPPVKETSISINSNIHTYYDNNENGSDLYGR